MSGIVVDGLRWEVRTRGTGRPLLLIHGFTGRGTSWGDHADAFARAFRTIVVDLPGHGRSAVPTDPRRASVECSADDLAAILRRLEAAPATSSATRSAPGSRSASPSRIRTSSTGWSSRARRPGSPTVASRAERRAADDALAEPHRARRDPGVRRRVGGAADLRQPGRACRAARAARIRRDPPRQPPRRAGRQPARRRPGRDGAARRSARRGPRPDARHRRRARRRRPARASSRSPPASRGPGSPSSTARATRPTTSGRPPSAASPSTSCRRTPHDRHASPGPPSSTTTTSATSIPARASPR